MDFNFGGFLMVGAGGLSSVGEVFDILIVRLVGGGLVVNLWYIGLHITLSVTKVI